MIRGWRMFNRWAKRCIRWTGVTRQQEEIGRRNVELLESIGR